MLDVAAGNDFQTTIRFTLLSIEKPIAIYRMGIVAVDLCCSGRIIPSECGELLIVELGIVKQSNDFVPAMVDSCCTCDSKVGDEAIW